ncbi:ERF family protein [Streptomyces sp. NPDC088348]|uniref:ERF family protein n=1 Tax=Streptomyces sp. NPDC088348 TaxID=3365853 RepID=UPI00380FE53A
MATATEAPATMAEGPTSHTQNRAHPTVHELMSRVMRSVRNLGKDGFNDHQKYKFRGVDGAIGALAQPLRDHGVFMTPEVLDCETEVRGKMNAVRMRVAFHFYGPAGDRVTAITMGEASDVADKASNKAMSAALKYALIHTFMIPVDEGSLDDGDRDHPVGQRSPADAYMERIRKPAVWNNTTALTAMHTEAKADGLLQAQVTGPNGPTTLGDLIVWRGTQLKAEAAEVEAKRQEEAPQAAAQVAAEHGVDPLDQLMGQVQRHWDSPEELTKTMAEANRRNQVQRMVEGPLGAQMPLGELLSTRIAELKVHAKAAAQDAHADVHDRSAA